MDDDDYNEYDSLFDDDTPEVKIEVLILKATTRYTVKMTLAEDTTAKMIVSKNQKEKTTVETELSRIARQEPVRVNMVVDNEL